MHAVPQSRLRIIAILLVLLGVLFIGRLYNLQIVHNKDYEAEAQKQYVATVPNLYNRGTIYFTQKNGTLVAAATIQSGYQIAMDPKMVVDSEGTYKKLSQILAIDHTDFMNKTQKKDDPFEVLAERVPDASGVAINKLDIPGITAYRQTWRYYPGGALAAQDIGFVAYNGNDLTGRYGIEQYYNDTLARSDQNLYVNFFAELFSNFNQTIFDQKKEDVGNVVMTIEPTVQSQLEKELKSVMDDWHSDESGGIIMDPKTGAIYAMAMNPSYNVNDFNKLRDVSMYGNPMVENDYEMGSIVKPLTMAAGLDTGVVSANTTYNDPGHMTMNNKTFSNWDGKARGPGTSMQEVLNQSLNTGAAFVESKIGNARFADYMLNKFHVGDETGVDLPGEIQGLTSNLHSKRDIEYATASFGQGIAVSPINIAASLAILGNGGVTISPHMVSEIQYDSGRIKKITPNPGVQVIKPETSNEITRMLVTVVDKALLKGEVKIPEYSIAAKTGTAQMARSSALGGGYYDDRYLHSFFGYFPAYEPKFIIFMYTKYPKNADFASHTLTAPFMRLTKFLLNYYDVPPDRIGTTGKQITILNQ